MSLFEILLLLLVFVYSAFCNLKLGTLYIYIILFKECNVIVLKESPNSMINFFFLNHRYHQNAHPSYWDFLSIPYFIKFQYILIYSWLMQRHFMTGFRFTWRCLWIIVGWHLGRKQTHSGCLATGWKSIDHLLQKKLGNKPYSFFFLKKKI